MAKEVLGFYLNGTELWLVAQDLETGFFYLLSNTHILREVFVNNCT